jgi:hypothetical protein
LQGFFRRLILHSGGLLFGKEIAMGPQDQVLGEKPLLPQRPTTSIATVNFPVSNVVAASEPLPEVSYYVAVQDLLSGGQVGRLQDAEEGCASLSTSLEEHVNAFTDDVKEALGRLRIAWTNLAHLAGTQDMPSVYRRMLEHIRPTAHAVQQADPNAYIPDIEELWIADVIGGHRQSLEEELAHRQQVLEHERSCLGRHKPVEACSRYHGQLLANVLAHPVIAALHHAFTDHRPVCLSPDMVWLLVCQGVANHINAHAEVLRPRFVRHQGKVKIEVRRDDFIKGSPENPWEEVLGAFSACIREHIGPAHDLFLPCFSTTGLVERTAAEIVLLDAMQSYFTYVLKTICGIPAITLEGTREDWQALADRAMAFAEYDLKWWLTPMQPILQQFVDAASGKVEPAFWRSIYKYYSFSGGAAVTGWITAFFPYLKDEQGTASRKNPWLAEGGARLQGLLGAAEDPQVCDGPSPDAFPSGLARAPFVWEYLNRKFPMEFLGGFVGVNQNAATLTLRPELGWVVREALPA